MTIFSASNYYETGSNKGAYLKLVGPEHALHFVQFNTKGTGPKELTFRQRVGLIESSAIRELTAKIQNNREKLMEAFTKLDPNDTGQFNFNTTS